MTSATLLSSRLTQLERKSKPRSIPMISWSDSVLEITMHIRKNQVVFSQGQTADCLYYLRSGRTKLTVTSELGKEVVFGIAEAKQFFGRLSRLPEF